MKLVVLSDHLNEGGAALATQRIVRSLAEQPVQISRVAFFPHPARQEGSHTLWYGESAVKRQSLRLLRRCFPSRFPRPHTAEFSAQRLRQVLIREQPDVINIHNLHAATPWGWGPQVVEVCLEFAPVVWTLHDMWSFTGRCAYSYDCEKFITGCDADCPTWTDGPALAPHKIHAAWRQRRDLYRQHRDDLVIVTPSQWLAKHARRGLFAEHRIEVIPYGLDLDVFKPTPRAEARRQLGIRGDEPVLLIAAFDLTERRKGAEILLDLWRQIQRRPFTVLTMGKGRVPIDDPGIHVHSLGWIDDDRTKALAYSAADALLHPAPADNFPNVVLEALACGTPTIALPVGGLLEMVRPGVSGWLAESPTAGALARAINGALANLEIGKPMRQSCRALAEAEFRLGIQGELYFQLFKPLRCGSGCETIEKGSASVEA